MTIDLNSSISKVSHYAFGSSALNSILSSSIFVAGVISLIMIVIVMILYPAKKNTPFFLICKMFVYMFFISWVVIFLHDGVVRYTFNDKQNENTSDDFMHNMIHKDPIYGNYTPITPTQPNTVQLNTVQTNTIQPNEQVPAKIVINSNDDIIGAGYLGGSHPPVIGGNPYK